MHTLFSLFHSTNFTCYLDHIVVFIKSFEVSRTWPRISNILTILTRYFPFLKPKLFAFHGKELCAYAFLKHTPSSINIGGFLERNSFDQFPPQSGRCTVSDNRSDYIFQIRAGLHPAMRRLADPNSLLLS